MRPSVTHPPLNSFPAGRYDVAPPPRVRGVEPPIYPPLDSVSRRPPAAPTLPSAGRQPIHQPVQHNPSQPLQIPTARPPSEVSILKTPSSLAPSMLKPTISRTSIPVSTTSQDSRKRGLFSMFKSKPQPPAQTYEVWNPPSAQGVEKTNNRSKAEPPKHSRMDADPKVSATPKARDPKPTPIPVASGHKTPNSRVFTPFRYLTSKRHRTMSAASVEAQDGTAVRVPYLFYNTLSFLNIFRQIL